ncbi:hypothetical protein C8T65DRAFT_738687 [Cerioporus squamosus]|nr:hypothetical protein C8T65DRAFT_738687 [Cerioporus squamosus]
MEEVSEQSQQESVSQFLAREGPALFSWASDFEGTPEFAATLAAPVCAQLAQRSFHLAQVALRVAWGLGGRPELQDDRETDFIMIRHELATAFEAVDAIIPRDARPFLSTPAAALQATYPCLANPAASSLPLASANPARPVPPVISPSPSAATQLTSPPSPAPRSSPAPVDEYGSDWVSPGQIIPSRPSSLPPSGPQSPTPMHQSDKVPVLRLPSPSAVDHHRLAGLLGEALLGPLSDKVLGDPFLDALADRVAAKLGPRVDVALAHAMEKLRPLSAGEGRDIACASPVVDGSAALKKRKCSTSFRTHLSPFLPSKLSDCVLLCPLVAHVM